MSTKFTAEIEATEVRTYEEVIQKRKTAVDAEDAQKDYDAIVSETEDRDLRNIFRKERLYRAYNRCERIRIMISYVLLTALSLYCIYDYRLRPDCLCRPRPYGYAISAFLLTALYGAVGFCTRAAREWETWRMLNYLRPAKVPLRILVFGMVLANFCAELWILKRMFRKMNYIRQMLAYWGYPAVFWLYFFQSPIFVIVEIQMLTLIPFYSVMALTYRSQQIILIPLLIYAAFFLHRRYYVLPITFPDCGFKKPEFVNYFLIAGLINASTALV